MARKLQTHPYDAAAYLKSEKDCALYMQAAIAESDGEPAIVVAALGDIAHPPLAVMGYDATKRLRYIGNRYTIPTMIKSFRCAETEALFNRKRVKRFVNVEAVARRKLNLVHAASSLSFLRVPPGNRLEALKGDRSGYYSIRINDQFRLCFRWIEGHAEDVEIVDYH